MAMTRRPRDGSGNGQDFWVTYTDIAESPGHPFYERLNGIFDKYEFDRFCEDLCAPYYESRRGRPSIRAGVYFRMLMVGYFEGIGSERSIAWRCADSMSLRDFLGISITERTPEHSSLTRIRQRFPFEVFQAVFQKILEVLQKEGLLKGKTLGIDATTLEANAAMRSIVRKLDGKSYEDFLKELAAAAGIENPTHQDLANMDRNRKDKKCSNKDSENPHDPDARITKMKNGSTHFAYKAEHAVDMDTGALTGVAMHHADKGDTETLWGSLAEAAKNLDAVNEETSEKGSQIEECVTDRGYHSGPGLVGLENVDIRSYIPEPKQGRRKWTKNGKKTQEKAAEQKAVYNNRRRVKGKRGKRLQRKRGELLERSFAHCLETGGMRRVWLRGLENVWKRYLIHCSAFNLSLVMRKIYQVGTPRAMDALLRTALSLFSWLFAPIVGPRSVQNGSRCCHITNKLKINRNRLVPFMPGQLLSLLSNG